MKYFFFVFIYFTLMSSLTSQVGGMRVYAGSSSLVNNDVIVNPTDYSYSGYHIGIDGRLMSGGMAFLVGGRFTSISNVALKDFKLIGHESSVAIMNGRVGLDISIYSFTSFARIRTKALVSFDIILSDSGSPIANPEYQFNSGWLGFVTGLGVDIGPATLDVEYELGVINAYFEKEKSTFNSLSFSIGFFF